MTKQKKDLKGFQDISLPIAIILVIAASLCFANSYDGEFVFDDSEAIVTNEDVKDAPMYKIFENDFWGTKLSHKQSHKSYRPLTILTFRLHYLFRGYLDPRDFHTVNVILHILVSVLTLFLYNTLLGESSGNVAFYAAMLFAVHPVHAEAVAGIVGRADMLCALFMWISILLYRKSIFAAGSFTKWMNMTLSMLCIMTSMLCKETGITAIGICCVYDLVVVNKLLPIDMVRCLRQMCSDETKQSLAVNYGALVGRIKTLSIAGFFLLLLRFSIMGFSPPRFQLVDNPASFVEPLPMRVLNFNYIYSLNAWLLLCPEWLSFDWAMGCVPLIHGLDVRILAVFALWIVLGSFCYYVSSEKHSEQLSPTIMGLALLMIPFLPATNLFFKVGFVLAERTLYIPSAGFCLLFAIGFQRLIEQCNGCSRTLLSLYFVLLAVFFARSWIRSAEWKTEKTLFRSALNVCPLNAKVHYNVAKNAADKGDSAHAEIEYNEALRLHPEYAQAMNNLGNLLKDRQRYYEAEKLLKRAVEIQSDFAAAWMNYGIVLAALKKPEESEKSYLTALSHRSKYPDCYYNLGVLYLEQRQYDKALMAWENATRQKPNHKRAWTNMILLLDDLGYGDKALSVGNKALKYLPEEASIYFNIGNILGKAGKFEEAEKQFNHAISRDSSNPNFYTNLGVLYHRWNKHRKAERMYKKALGINPNLQSARDNLKKLRIG
ncbi:protein O-mannosyl-transferase TMTC4 isoform X1 [Neodiprion virginianus]|uniref:protein O-mannosyl-transferase TMTC4 isoform X1 n=1 Tax=Neodiprion virginianus TaxID=2961670 RepID=UPI001EE76994|nr:protein O-mannosyl-transferase TMTC4 isoform X1 [Neodiprion virginianus]